MNNETINYYRVEFADETGIIKSEKTYKKTKQKILAKNDNYICLEDFRFTSLEIKEIGKPSIFSYANDRVWGNRVTYTLYSYKNVRPSTIKRQIKSHIKEKYGFFTKDIDLSFIENQGTDDEIHPFSEESFE